MNKVIIAEGKLCSGQLQGQVAVVTGAGGGIGFQAARALLWLGVRVVIAEISEEKGQSSVCELQHEFGSGSACFCRTDIGDQESVRNLAAVARAQFGQVDIVINNATVAFTGAVHNVDIANWDQSYAVNLRGPVLLTKEFLPEMLRRNQGVFVYVSSSGAAPYLGAYEVMKTAQVELANTLAAELEQTGVVAYTIGPGIVNTETADNAIRQVAGLYGMTVQQFYAMNADKNISVEAAGAGFAASVAMAEKYRGTEIGSIQALLDAGIRLSSAGADEVASVEDLSIGDASASLAAVIQTLAEQSAGWYQRNIFERQWVLRDFKKTVGSSPEVYAQLLNELASEVQFGKASPHRVQQLPKLVEYYRHQLELLKGYEKDPVKVREHSGIIEGWIAQVEDVIPLLGRRE